MGKSISVVEATACDGSPRQSELLAAPGDEGGDTCCFLSAKKIQPTLRERVTQGVAPGGGATAAGYLPQTDLTKISFSVHAKH